MTNDIRELSHIWPRTDRVGAARCYASQCADILELNQRTVGTARSAKSHFFAVMNENDEPLALFPLSVERRKLMRILTFLDGGLSDYNAPILFPPSREWTADDISAVWSRMKNILRPDLIRLEKVPRFIGDIPNPMAHFSLGVEGESAHAMTLAGTWEELSTRLPRWKDIKARERRLAKDGKLEFVLAESVGEYDEFVEALIEQKTSRYLETSGRDGMDRPGYRAFLRDARKLIYPAGPVCLFVLKVDDSILATTWGAIVGDIFYSQFFSFDAKWRKYSPGHQLNRRIIEWCFANKIRRFDFGVGDEEYKQDYCDTTSTLHRGDIAATIRGQLFLRMRNAKRRLAG